MPVVNGQIIEKKKQFQVTSQPYCLECFKLGYRELMDFVDLLEIRHPVVIGLWRCPCCRDTSKVSTRSEYVEMLN